MCDAVSTRYGMHGAVACASPLASAAAIDAMRLRGGNAVDAAVTAAAVLAVVQPCSNGIGGDAFALLRTEDGRVRGLNGSGRSPSALSLDAVPAAARDARLNRIKCRHALCATVPGAVKLWEQLLERHGRLSLAAALEPAIAAARDGYLLTPVVSHLFARRAELLRDVATRGGTSDALCLARAKAGDVVTNAPLAQTLANVAAHGADAAFYTGPVAHSIVDALRRHGGVLELDDLAAHARDAPALVDATVLALPLSGGRTLYELGDNTQGIVAAQAAALLDDERFACVRRRATRFEARSLAAQIDALRLAFTDAFRHVADGASLDGLLAPAYIERRRALLSSSRALALDALTAPPPGGTVYLATASPHGDVCSFIQSNYEDFGTGIVCAGFSLQNRAHGFTLDAASPNAVGARKRPYHTIIPGLLQQHDDDSTLAFGNMGAWMQPQGHVQLLNNLSSGLTLQEAVDAPRFRLMTHAMLADPVAYEAAFAPTAIEQLCAMGHALEAAPRGGFDRLVFGNAQMVRRNAHTGMCEAATDSRHDGAALCY